MMSYTCVLILTLTFLRVVLSVDMGGESIAIVPTSFDLPEVIEEDFRFECAQLYRCGDDQACIAQCYGVPSPDTDQVLATLDCYAQCQSAPSSVGACQTECLSNHYQPSLQHHPVSIQPSPPSPTSAVSEKPPPAQNNNGITRKRAENGSPILSVTGYYFLMLIVIINFFHC